MNQVPAILEVPVTGTLPVDTQCLHWNQTDSHGEPWTTYFIGLSVPIIDRGSYIKDHFEILFAMSVKVNSSSRVQLARKHLNQLSCALTDLEHLVTTNADQAQRLRELTQEIREIVGL